jgi:hypothetical protein
VDVLHIRIHRRNISCSALCYVVFLVTKLKPVAVVGLIGLNVNVASLCSDGGTNEQNAYFICVLTRSAISNAS